MMTKLNPAKTLELSEAATPGEWCYDDHIVNKGDTPGHLHVYEEWRDDGPIATASEGERADVELIVHNRNTCEAYASWVQRALPLLKEFQSLLEHTGYVLDPDATKLIEEVEE